LKKAIDKLKKFGASNSRPDYMQLEKLMTQQVQKTPSSTLPVKLGDRIILLDHEEIIYLKAEDKYTCIYLENGKKHLSSQSLGKLESTLPAIFIRVHRSYIINKKHIMEVRKYFKGKLILTMKDKDRTAITTGEKYSADVKVILGL